jgi:hypothetical protein
MPGRGPAAALLAQVVNLEEGTAYGNHWAAAEDFHTHRSHPVEAAVGCYSHKALHSAAADCTGGLVHILPVGSLAEGMAADCSSSILEGGSLRLAADSPAAGSRCVIGLQRSPVRGSSSSCRQQRSKGSSCTRRSGFDRL